VEDMKNYKWLPTSTIDSLISPKININLKKGLREKNPLSKDLLSQELYRIDQVIKNRNEYLPKYAVAVNFPVVDIYSLYEKVFKGILITDDGVRVTQSNFFSIDGINPTPLGQAIIANEVIKTMNKHYSSEIPLIKTAEYLEK
jgi:hypothetical protein